MIDKCVVLAGEVKLKQAEIWQKIKNFQNAGYHAWKDLKSGIDLAYSAMGEAIDSARSRFR